MTDSYMVGVSFVLLLFSMAALFFVTNYQIITGVDEIKQLIIKKTSDTSSDVPVSFDKKPNATINICGPVSKLMEQWMPNNKYECHKF